MKVTLPGHGHIQAAETWPKKHFHGFVMLLWGAFAPSIYLLLHLFRFSFKSKDFRRPEKMNEQRWALVYVFTLV